MFGPKITLTRQELYEKVWSTPVQKLAAEFGFSDRGLAKLCKRFQIPVPPRGYWARLQVGQTPDRTALPVPKDPRLDRVEIYPHERPPEQPAEIEATEIPTIHVAADRLLSHPLTLQIERSLSKTKKDERGMLIPHAGMVVPVLVSDEQLPRALRIMDVLLDVVDQSELDLTWEKPHDKALKVTVLDEALEFRISEAVKRRDHQAMAGEKHLSYWQIPRYDYEPTGCLTLAIEGVSDINVRHSWSDGKKQRVEDVLGRFLVTLPAVAKALKRQREGRAEQARRWEEERKRQAEEATRRAEYQRKAKVVEGLAQSWEQSKSLRAFAERLDAVAEQEGLSEEQRREIKSMAEWTTRHAVHADPLTHPEWMTGQFKKPSWS